MPLFMFTQSTRHLLPDSRRVASYHGSPGRQPGPRKEDLIVTAFSKCLADSRLDVLGRVDQVLNHDSLYYSIFVYTTRYSWILSKHLGLGGKVRSINGLLAGPARFTVGSHDVSYSWLARNIVLLCHCFKATPRCQLRPSNIFGFRNQSLHWQKQCLLNITPLPYDTMPGKVRTTVKRRLKHKLPIRTAEPGLCICKKRCGKTQLAQDKTHTEATRAHPFDVVKLVLTL